MMRTMFCTFVLIFVIPQNLHANRTLSSSSHQESSLGDHMQFSSAHGSTHFQGKYTTQSRTEGASASKHLSVYVTDQNDEDREITLVKTTTEETPSSPHVLPLGKLTNESLDYNQSTQTVKSSTEQSTYGLIFTQIKLPDNSPQTTNSSEKPFTEVRFHKTPVTARNEQVTPTKAKQTLEQEKTVKPANLTTSPPNPESTTYSKGHFDPSSGKPSGTELATSTVQITFPLNTTMTTTTGISTSVRTQTATTVIATSDTKTTGATTTRQRTTDKKNLIPETTPKQMSTSTTQTVTTQNTKSTRPPQPAIPELPNKKQAKKGHSAGPTVATLIGIILVLMFIGIAAIFVRHRQMKKKQMEDPDWAGPSPFIEGEIQTNQPNLEDGLFQHKEPPKKSLISFLPQRLSKRLSIVKETDEVFLEDISVHNTTFGQNEFKNPTNGKPAVDQTQQSDADCQNQTVINSVTDMANIQAPPKSDDANSSLQSETLQPSFEDVDLRGPLEGNTDFKM